MSPALLFLLAFVAVTNGQQSWANLNCPAPRSPENGLSFIFQQGQEVRFKCHPGFLLVGSPVSKCDNNLWDNPVPDCLPEKGEDPSTPKEDPPHVLPSTTLPDRPLFSWDRPNGIDYAQDGYGQGSRRLPLINGLWRQKPVNKVAQLPRNFSHGAPAGAPFRANASRDLYSQELSIAETRHRQQQEARDNSVLRGAEAFPRNRDFRQGEIDAEAERRRWRISEARKTPNIQYAGSRSASAYRAFPSVSTRTSASGHVTTIIESRSYKPQNVTRAGDTVQADLSCLQSRSGRRLFIRAPKVPNAYVYRYERKKHEYAPFKPYLAAEFRCRRGFKLVDQEKNFLLCRRMEWVGEKPTCVKTV